VKTQWCSRVFGVNWLAVFAHSRWGVGAVRGSGPSVCVAAETPELDFGVTPKRGNSQVASVTAGHGRTRQDAVAAEQRSSWFSIHPPLAPAKRPMGGRGSRRATVNCRVSLVVHDETFVPGLKSRLRLLFLASGMLGLPLVLGVNPARPSFALTKPRRSGRLCVAQPFRGLINSQQRGRFAIVTTLVLGGRSMGFGPCVHRVHAPRPQASRQRQLTGVVFSCAVGGWGLVVVRFEH
jgi:hypothetical protein